MTFRMEATSVLAVFHVCALSWSNWNLKMLFVGGKPEKAYNKRNPYTCMALSQNCVIRAPHQQEIKLPSNLKDVLITIKGSVYCSAFFCILHQCCHCFVNMTWTVVLSCCILQEVAKSMSHHARFKSVGIIGGRKKVKNPFSKKQSSET